MEFKGLALGLVFICAVLAGCGGKSDSSGDAGAPLPPDKGAIRGVTIDDRFRPVPDAEMLLFPIGLTTTSGVDGEFEFLNLAPGAYVLRVQADGHEASPISVDAVAGEYTEVEAVARRVFSSEGAVLVTQYSVFIDCSFEALAIAGTGAGCMADQSGDSTRTGFDTDLDPADANITTYMVTEILYNKQADAPGQGGYGVVIGVLDSSNFFEIYYAESDLIKGTYQRIQNEAGKVNNRTDEDVGGRNVKWPPGKLFTTAIFPHGTGYTELQNNPTGIGLWGAGASVGVKAKIVQSIFLGPPNADIETYCVLCPK